MTLLLSSTLSKRYWVLYSELRGSLRPFFFSNENTMTGIVYPDVLDNFLLPEISADDPYGLLLSQHASNEAWSLGSH
jgi:hypothetical protein